MYSPPKRILFLIGNLESGGVSKSMVSLLNTIDRQQYEVSLWMGSPEGLFRDLLPKDITLLSDERITLLLKGTRGLQPLLRRGHFFLFLGSILRLMLAGISKAYAGWLLARLMPAIGREEYDLIVDYNGQHQLYYMVDKLRGRRKASFFHSDYAKWPYYYRMDKRYYPHVDRILTISEVCVQSLKNYFPEQAKKVELMENITSPALIRSMAEQQITDFEGELKILTLGHICKNKGTDLAIRAAAILRDNGIRFKWFFLGKEAEDFRGLIAQLGLDEYIVYLGMRANPYPYLKQADLYVHPSLYEGKSIALDEAKLLCKPIVVTNFSTVRDQFQDRTNASICRMEPASIASAVEELLGDAALRTSYVQYLQAHQTDNTSEVNKIYAMVE